MLRFRLQEKPKGRRFCAPLSSRQECQSAQIVELTGHRGLFACSIVLVQQAFSGSAVNSLNSNFIGIGGCVLIPFDHSSLADIG